MKVTLNLSNQSEVRLYQNTEYTLTAEVPIILSTKEDANLLYPKCAGNGTTEVYLNVGPGNMKDRIWAFIGDNIINVRFEFSEQTMALAMEDAIAPYIGEEYPLFKKLMEYYFLYLGQEFKPSDFIQRMEKYAHIDETFDEFRESIYAEVLSELPTDTAASREILSKYILQFYKRRGTEDSIRFLIRILYNEEILFERGRDQVLICSDDVQGELSNPNYVLQDNDRYQLFSYVITSSKPFYYFKELLYRLVNPTGYLPFGKTIVTRPVE